MYGRGLRSLSISAVAALVGAFALVFFYAPNEADQGFIYKIFFLHVPLAIVSLGGFVAGGIYGIKHLRSGRREDDMKSYVAIHVSIMLGLATLATGMIWAKASWGHWWLWDEPTLVAFLIVFLLYACYQPLRFSIEDPERQARYAAVFAIIAGAFVPICFMSVRFAQAALTHPRVFDQTDGGMPGSMFFTFLCCLAAMTLFYVVLWKFELTSKHARAQLGALRRRLVEA